MAKGNYGVNSLGGGSGIGGGGAGSSSDSYSGTSERVGANGKAMRAQIEPIILVDTSWEAHELTAEQLDTINAYALEHIQKETGFSPMEAKEAQNAMLDYFGGDYKAYKSGEKKENIDKIDHTLSKMQAYDGTIYRGMSFLDKEKYNDFMQKIQSSGYYGGDTSVSSWTSDEYTARNFSSEAFSTNSILIICDNNTAAVGVQHISKFGLAESEILAPSGVKWKVKNITTKTTPSGFNKTVIEVSQENYKYKKQ